MNACASRERHGKLSSMIRFCVSAALLLSACSANNSEATTTANPASSDAMGSDDGAEPADSETPSDNTSTANVTAVTATGDANAYTFAVTLASPDTGCEQYADWWEVLDADGTLLYRRILGHSHVDEQPFTRTGGPVAVEPDQVVFVRAHMNNGGFGQVLTGTAADGFSEARALPEIAASVEAAAPQPTDCAF